jgi:hypothetical protein
MPDPIIELYPGAEAQPFASMMVELLRTNLRDHPEKRRAFDGMHGQVTLVAEDAATAVSLCFAGGKLSVHAGVRAIPDVVIRGSSGSLIDLSRVPPHSRLKALPDWTSQPARALGAALRGGKLRIYGLLTHLPLGLRLAKVLSIY